MPLNIAKTWRVQIHNGSGVAIPANKITVSLMPFTAPAGVATFPASAIAVIAPSDGSPASAGIASNAFATSVITWVDNSSTGYLGGSLFLKIDFTGLTPASSGTVWFYIQNSPDGGTTWPPNGSGFLVPTGAFTGIASGSSPTDVVSI